MCLQTHTYTHNIHIQVLARSHVRKKGHEGEEANKSQVDVHTKWSDHSNQCHTGEGSPGMENNPSTVFLSCCFSSKQQQMLLRMSGCPYTLLEGWKFGQLPWKSVWGSSKTKKTSTTWPSCAIYGIYPKQSKSACHRGTCVSE